MIMNNLGERIPLSDLFDLRVGHAVTTWKDAILDFVPYYGMYHSARRETGLMARNLGEFLYDSIQMSYQVAWLMPPIVVIMMGSALGIYYAMNNVQSLLP